MSPSAFSLTRKGHVGKHFSRSVRTTIATNTGPRMTIHAISSRILLLCGQRLGLNLYVKSASRHLGHCEGCLAGSAVWVLRHKSQNRLLLSSPRSKDHMRMRWSYLWSLVHSVHTSCSTLSRVLHRGFLVRRSRVSKYCGSRVTILLQVQQYRHRSLFTQPCASRRIKV